MERPLSLSQSDNELGLNISVCVCGGDISDFDLANFFRCVCVCVRHTSHSSRAVKMLRLASRCEFDCCVTTVCVCVCDMQVTVHML